MSSSAANMAQRLARNAEAVCRHYLSNGHREGRYWLVGDVANTPGRSLFVRLSGPDSGKGVAGKWTDAATGEHGDLLDLIALNRGLDHLRDALDEARFFLSLPRSDPVAAERQAHTNLPRLTAIRAPALCHVRADRGHDRSVVFAGSRHYIFTYRQSIAFSSTVLLSPSCRQCDRNLAGADRGSHRSRRQDHRRTSHLARSVGPRQGSL
jgi:hypothetical protein